MRPTQEPSDTLNPEAEAFRKRLAKIYGIERFRVDVTLDAERGILVLVDGKDLTEEQERILQEDIQNTVAQHRKAAELKAKIKVN